MKENRLALQQERVERAVLHCNAVENKERELRTELHCNGRMEGERPCNEREPGCIAMQRRTKGLCNERVLSGIAMGEGRESCIVFVAMGEG